MTPRRQPGPCLTLPTFLCHCLAVLFLVGQPLAAQTNTPEWTFVSSPDWFNTDIADLSGATPGVAAAPGWALGASDGRNGVTPEMLAAYGQVAAEMAEGGPELFLVAGDLINGRWYSEALLDMFDPVTRDRGRGIDTAGSIYYGWYRQFLGQHGFAAVLGAIGDHELGDDPWPAGDEKSIHLGTMRASFGREVVAPLALAGQLGGVSTRPLGTPFAESSYAVQHRNVLFVSVDVFNQASPASQSHPLYGTVTPEVEGAHLTWLEDILSAADAEPGIDHVIVQIHTPVLSPVRMQSTSGIMLEHRKASAFWQTLDRHDHGSGGKVRLLFAGEVHTSTVTHARGTDILQFAHGDPPRASGSPPTTQYAVFSVHPTRIEASVVNVQLDAVGTGVFWQPSEAATPAVTGAGQGRVEGSLSLRTGGAETEYEGTGWLTVARDDGLALHFTFDEPGPQDGFVNTGSLGNVYYDGKAQGGVANADGLLGSALRLNGQDAYVESGRGNPTGSDARSVTAWIRTSATGQRVILSYGNRRMRLPTYFDFRLRQGKLQLAAGPDNVCRAAGMPAINDGKWHHVGVVLPKDDANGCANVRFFADGIRYPVATPAPVGQLQTVPWTNFRVGVDRTGTRSFFEGDLDDVALWGGALEDGEMRALMTAARATALGYSAREMDLLVDLYRDGAGSVEIGDRSWVTASGLTGDAGDVIESGDVAAIQFDADGNGVRTADSVVTEQIYEAEEAGLSGNALLKTRYPGYTGSGYVEFREDAAVEWHFTVPAAGGYELGFRYAVGIRDRRIDVTLDGVVLDTPVEMPTTGKWTQWAELAFDQELSAGPHTLVLSSPNLRGPNVDHLVLRGSAAPALVARPADLAFPVAVGSGWSAFRDLELLTSDGTSVPIGLSTDRSWLEVQPGDGVAPLEAAVRVDPGSRGAGTYEGSVFVSAAGYPTLTVPVLMTVTESSDDFLIEAEDAQLSGGYIINDRYPGYTGTGYVEFREKTAASFHVSVAVGGEYRLAFRYAVGISDRTAQLSVDGQATGALTIFPSTGKWTTWGEAVAVVVMEAGDHEIRLSSPQKRGPNLDHLAIRPAD